MMTQRSLVRGLVVLFFFSVLVVFVVPRQFFELESLSIAFLEASVCGYVAYAFGRQAGGSLARARLLLAIIIAGAAIPFASILGAIMLGPPAPLAAQIVLRDEELLPAAVFAVTLFVFGAVNGRSDASKVT